MDIRAQRKDKTSTSPRRLRNTLFVVAGFVCWVLVISANVVFPPQGQSGEDVDAVVSLAPQFNRLPTARQLLDQADDSVLLVSYFAHDPYMGENGPIDESESFARYCADGADDRITCFTPEEESTLGEALAIGDMAEESSWDSVTVVTSKYHVFRTRLIFDRCIGADTKINVVHSEPKLSASQWIWHITYENAAYFKALFETTFRC